MKKKLIFLASCVIIAFLLTSCETLIKDCKNCKKVYYSGNVRDHEDTAVQYCGAALITVETTPPYTQGSLTVKYECN